MKKIFLSLLFLASVCMAQAFTEQFKLFDNGPKTKSCRTTVVNISNERDPLYCSYVFTPYQRGKKEGTLLFEFLMNPDNETSVEIKNKVLAILKSLKEESWAKVSITIEMNDGEQFIFDSTSLGDWSPQEWRQLLRVSYDRENGDYRTYIMFPLEQMRSSQQELATAKKRHKHIIERLVAQNISRILVNKNTAQGVIELAIPFQRPTDGTFTDMLRRIKKKK